MSQRTKEKSSRNCHIVAYYHLVEAVDNGSDIHSKLTENADHALKYWVSLLLLPTSRIAFV